MKRPLPWDQEERWRSLAEVKRLRSYNTERLLELCQTGQVRSQLIGRTRYVKVSEVDKAMAAALDRQHQCGGQ